MLGLDAFQTYLIIVNVVAFIAFTVDFHVYKSTGNELFNHVALNIFAVIGGAAGMLLAFLVWDRKIRKANVAWRFIALAMLLIWMVIIANVYGPNRFSFKDLVSNFGNSHAVLLWYLAIVNVATFVVFVVDKLKAISGAWRIKEAVLMGLSFIGGSVGGMLGMLVAHHKVSTYYFKYGLPAMLVVQLIVVAYLIQAGIA